MHIPICINRVKNATKKINVHLEKLSGQDKIKFRKSVKNWEELELIEDNIKFFLTPDDLSNLHLLEEI